jgi:hypothetical protein
MFYYNPRGGGGNLSFSIFDLDLNDELSYFVESMNLGLMVNIRGALQVFITDFILPFFSLLLDLECSCQLLFLSALLFMSWHYVGV